MKKELVKGMALAIGAASFASALAPRITMAESTAGLSSEDISALLPIIAAAVAVVAYVSISTATHHIKNKAKQHEAGMTSIDLMRLQRMLVAVDEEDAAAEEAYQGAHAAPVARPTVPVARPTVSAPVSAGPALGASTPVAAAASSSVAAVRPSVTASPAAVPARGAVTPSAPSGLPGTPGGTPTNGARQARQAPAVSPQMGSGTRPAAAVRTNVGTSSQVPAPTTPTADHRSGGEDVRKPKHMATRVAA